ncbi:hypothetical protein AgCh_022895 [Apium graveolens]
MVRDHACAKASMGVRLFRENLFCKYLYIPSTLSSNRYFLLLVDDFSRAMWVYMLKTRDEALVCFKRFKALVEKESSEAIKVLRRDRGGKFCSMEFKTFCEDIGILRHYTAPYSPQQNGVVEYRNRTVTAMARSLLCD